MKNTIVKLVVFTLSVGLPNLCNSQETLVQFKVTDTPEKLDYGLGIRGNTAPLSWEKSLPISGNSISITFPAGIEEIEYKYVIGTSHALRWEGISNRNLTLSGKPLTQNDIWNKEPAIDISPLKDIRPEKLLEDLEFVKTMVLNVHPGTYRYNSKEDIGEVLLELGEKFQNTLSLGEAYLALSKVTASIQCDHTKVGFNNQNKYVNGVIHEQEDKLPFTFKWFGERMLVDLNASEHPQLEKGAEIKRINDIPVNRILEQLLPYVAADGATDKNRVAKLEVDGFDFRYNAFDVFFPLRFPVEDHRFDLEVVKNGTKIRIEVHGIHREERAKILAERYPEFPFSRDDTWKFEIKNGIGILTLNSFGLLGWKAMTIDYKKFLDDAFTELDKAGVQKLVVDIRKNTGGMDEMKNELFSFLPIDREGIGLFPREGRTRYLKFPEALKPHIKTWGENPWYYSLDADRADGEYYVFEEKVQNRLPLPAKPNVFKGEVILLTSPLNTSLAYYTARDFKQFGIGKLIGEETGGNQREINGGQIVFLTLPNSGIEIDFPVMGAFAKKEMPNSGVVPDYKVETTLKEFVSDQDPQMKKAIELLNQD